MPLRTGMAVEILPSHSENGRFTPDPSEHQPSSSPDEKAHLRPWVPEPLEGNQALRRKYGVFLEAKPSEGAPPREVYQMAYLDKLRRLIEKEIQTPIAVILDRYFSAPHLASGDPKAIAAAMWGELDEIRRPAVLLEEWIESPDASNFANLIYPRSAKELNQAVVNEEQLAEELKTLSLENFLDSL
jgi:hypothetical protein